MCPSKGHEAYKYTKLNELREGFNYNVFGILVEVTKESVPTSSGILHSIFNIVDESLPPNEVFRMHSFIHSVTLPKFTVGDILRFHRVKVETSWHGGSLGKQGFDGRIFNSTDVVSFSSDCASGFSYTSAANTITLSDQAKMRISELREIAQLNSLLFESSLELASNMTGIPENVPTNKETTIGTHASVNETDLDSKKPKKKSMEKIVQISSKKLLQNPAAAPSGSKCLLPNPFYDKNKETQVGSSNKRTSLELDTPSDSEKTDVNENIDGQKGSISENVTVRKKHKPCPLSRKKQCNETTSSRKEQDTEDEELSSAAVLAQRAHSLIEKPNELNEALIHDVASCSQAETSSTCPGITCAEENCGQTPVLIASDAGHSESEDPTHDNGGEIPAADDQGNVFTRNLKYMSIAVEEKNTYIDAHSMENFKWPCYSVKVRITKTKPSLQVLKSHGPKNLLSGVCRRCGTYSFYSKLKWKINKDTSTKIPLCPLCNEDGVTSGIYIEFRLQLTIVDAWGTHLNVYVTREKAAKFLGCSQSQYQISSECRQKTLTLLSDALSSKRFFNIFLSCVNTMSKKMIFVYDTELSKALSNDH